jgi:predicted dehydrogenase
MIRAAIVGIGTWGRNLVAAVEGSELIRFVAGATRTPATAELYCKQQGIRLMESY